MKHLLLASLLAAPTLAFAQTQRVVLLEYFTQASCPPCASTNPIIAQRINAATAPLVVIKYHTSWPGVDPMYTQNTADNGARTTYYGVSSVPTSIMNGRRPTAGNSPGSPSSWNVDTINAQGGVPSPFELKVKHNYIISNNRVDSIAVRAVVTKVADATGDLRLQTVVIEKEIVFPTAPGSNGETVFPHVMKKMLPNANGTTLPTAMAIGDSMVYNFKWRLANVYDIRQLAVVGFIQNNTGKRVLQGGYSAPTQPVPFAVTNVPRLIMASSTDTITQSITVTTTATSPTQFKVSGPRTQIAGTSTKLLDATGQAVDSMEITADAANPVQVPVQVIITNGTNLRGNITLQVRPSDPRFQAFVESSAIPVYSRAELLVISKDANTSVAVNAPTQSRSRYIMNRTESGSFPAELISRANYSKILIGSANEFSGLLTAAQIDSLAAFMDAGGDVALMGCEWGYFGVAGSPAMTSLLRDYFGARYTADGPGANGADGTVSVRAVTGDTIATGFVTTNMGSASYDQLALVPPGVASFTYANSTPAGIRTRVGDRRTFFASFPLNSVAPASNRNRFVTNLLNYFDGLSVTSTEGEVSLMPMVVAPNPTQGEARFLNLLPGDVVRLTDLAGRLVAEGTATANQLTLSLEGRPAGLYLATHVRRNAVVGMVQVSVVR